MVSQIADLHYCKMNNLHHYYYHVVLHPTTQQVLQQPLCLECGFRGHHNENYSICCYTQFYHITLNRV